MRVAPVTLAEANLYVSTFHRHTGPLPSAKFAVALVDDDGLVLGVGVAGLPKAKVHMDRHTLEVNRVCTDGAANGCSMLYGALTRAAKALGYRRLLTYTLASEPGVSLRASGWKPVATSVGGSWATVGRPPVSDNHDLGPKVRWEIQVADEVPDLRWPTAVTDRMPPTLFDEVVA